MKKLVSWSLFLVLVGITIIACQKGPIKNQSLSTKNPSLPIKNQSLSKQTKPLSQNLDISLEEFQQIINSDNSSNKRPNGWWEKFKKWVKAHSGNSQQYDAEGQPICSGGGACGPCPGICFGGGIKDGGNNGWEVSEEEFNQGLRAIAFSIFENIGNPNKRKMVVQIPSEYENDFIFNNNVFKIENDETLPTFYSNEAGFDSITVKSGIYPVIKFPKKGMTMTIVNITVK